MTMKPPYCELHGLICTDVVTGLRIDGAELKSTSHTLPSRRYAEITSQGRGSRKITIDARFLTEEDLDLWIGHINSAPEDWEAYLYRDDRCCYIKDAYAVVNDPEGAHIDGQWTTFFRGKAQLLSREPWQYGVNKGARYDSPVPLPVTISDIEHEGTVVDLSGIDKLSAVGYYNPTTVVASLISVAGDGSVFVVYDDGVIKSIGKDLPSITLSSPNSTPVSIFAKNSNLLYAVCADGDLRYWEDGTWYLWPATTNAKKVAVGVDDDTVVIIDSDDDVCVWSGGSWISKSKTAKEIICVSSSEIYIIGSDDHFWRYNGSAWAELEGTTAISKIALAQDATHGIFALDATGGDILKWTGDIEGWAAWAQDPLGVPPSRADVLSVRSYNEMWAISVDGLIAIWDGTFDWIHGYIHGGGGGQQHGTWILFDPFYCTNFTVSCGSQSVLLCRKLLANDLFEVDRFGNVEHSYENDFDCTVEKLQKDLHGPVFVEDVTTSNGKMTVAGEAKFLMSFLGPLKISGEKPYLEMDIYSIGQYPPKLIAYGGVAGTIELDTSLLHTGRNRIYIPGFEGQENLYVGFVNRHCWVSADNLNGPILDAVGDGDAEGAIIIGGEYMLTPYGAELHIFTGSNWLEGEADLSTGRYGAAGGGSSANAIVMGGYVNGNDYSTSTEEFNGSAWSAGGNLLTGRHWLGGGGNSASAFVAGGNASSVMTSGQTEEYNGTAWSSNGNLGYCRGSLNGGGLGTSAMVCGGLDEYYVCPHHDVSSGGAWSSVSGLLTARYSHAADGDYEYGFACGGHSGGGSILGSTEEHDGYTWSQGAQMLTSRSRLMGGASWLNGGFQTGFSAGGVHTSGRYVYHDYCTELYGNYCSITIDWLKAVVKRVINPDNLPTVSPGDVFDLQVASGGGYMLTSLEIYFRDAWWF